MRASWFLASGTAAILGLALGDCVMGSGWSLLSLALNTRTYNFFGE